MEKVLQLVFKKADGSKKVFSVTDPRDDEAVEARVRTTEVNVLA